MNIINNLNIHIVTVATESKYYFPYLVESCKKKGKKKLQVLGFREEWKGFNWRYRKMIIYLKKINPYDIVCFIDGYDVICCRDLNEIIPIFLKIREESGCKMIVSHGKLFFFNNIAYFYFGQCKDLSLNAGSYIAFAKDMLIIIEKIYNLNPKDDADDQVLLTEYCKSNKKDIYIDEKNEIFLTISHSLYDIGNYVTYDKMSKSIIYNNQKPFFIHAPGFGYLDSIIIKSGYSTECNIKNKLFYNFFREKILLYLLTKDNFIIILMILMIILYYFDKKYQNKNSFQILK